MMQEIVINKTLNDSSLFLGTQIVDEQGRVIPMQCMEWCYSLVPDTCTQFPPQIYLGLFLLLLAMTMIVIDKPLSKIIGYFLILIAGISFFVGWYL